MSNEPIFIGSPTDIVTGQSALDRLQVTSDLVYETDDGVVSVPLERWHKAQEYERATWIDQNQGSIDDRSDAHRDGFGNYEALPKNLGNVVEFGCGPFTQIRNILRDHAADSITLIDPLAKDYQDKHQHCSYKNDLLDGKPVIVEAVVIETLFGKTEPQFDTVVFINVLSHCYDANKVLEVVWRSLKPGGTLLFHEHIEERGANVRYDVGHPLTVRQNVLETFLARFEGVVETSQGYWIATKGVEQVPSPPVGYSDGIVAYVALDSEPETEEATALEIVTVEPVEPAALEPTTDDIPVQESGDDTAVSNIAPPKKRGRKKKSE